MGVLTIILDNGMWKLLSKTVKYGSGIEQPGKNENQENNMEKDTIKLTAGSKAFITTLTGNPSMKDHKGLLVKGNISVEMWDYANMEKVDPLEMTLTRNDEHITTSAGDWIL